MNITFSIDTATAELSTLGEFFAKLGIAFGGNSPAGVQVDRKPTTNGMHVAEMLKDASPAQEVVTVKTEGSPDNVITATLENARAITNEKKEAGKVDGIKKTLATFLDAEGAPVKSVSTLQKKDIGAYIEKVSAL